MGDRKDTGALLALLICGLGFGSTPLWVLLSNWDQIGTLWARAIGATLFMVAVFWPRLKRSIQLLRGSWKPCLMAGVWAAASTTTFAWAFFHVNASVVYIIYYTYPAICLVVDAVFFKRRPSRLEMGGLALALAGLVIAMGGDLTVGGLGVGAMLALFSSLTWVGHIYTAKTLKSSDETLAALILGQCAVAVGLFVVLLVRMQQSQSLVAMPSTMQTVWLVMLGLAAAVSVFCWGLGVRQIPGSVAGAITMVEAPIGILLVSALGQAVTTKQLIGGAMILVAALALTLQKKE